MHGNNRRKYLFAKSTHLIHIILVSLPNICKSKKRNENKGIVLKTKVSDILWPPYFLEGTPQK